MNRRYRADSVGDRKECHRGKRQYNADHADDDIALRRVARFVAKRKHFQEIMKRRVADDTARCIFNLAHNLLGIGSAKHRDGALLELDL